MKLRQLKVRPKKAAVTNPCQAEFIAMLGCWASRGDMSGMGECRDSARMLQECMRLQVSITGDLHPDRINDQHQAKRYCLICWLSSLSNPGNRHSTDTFLSYTLPRFIGRKKRPCSIYNQLPSRQMVKEALDCSVVNLSASFLSYRTTRLQQPWKPHGLV